jgi:hypothetical protein
MKLERKRSLAPWRWYHWRFALLPTWFGDNSWIWFEPYQRRSLGLSGEIRDRSGKTEAYYVHV